MDLIVFFTTSFIHEAIHELNKKILIVNLENVSVLIIRSALNQQVDHNTHNKTFTVQVNFSQRKPTKHSRINAANMVSHTGLCTVKWNCTRSRTWNGITHQSYHRLRIPAHLNSRVVRAIAFGIGLEVKWLFWATTQCTATKKTKKNAHKRNISISVGAKDVALYIISQLSHFWGTGYFVIRRKCFGRNVCGQKNIGKLEYRNGFSWRYDCPDQKKHLISLEGRLYAPKAKPGQRVNIGKR
jgi:hypothetical protein